MPLQKIVFYMKSALILFVILGIVIMMLYEYKNSKENINKITQSHHIHMSRVE